MNTIKRLACMLAIAALPASTVVGQTLDLGSAIPMSSTSMEMVSGGSSSLDGIKGNNGLVVAFWSNTCPWVTKYEQRLADAVGAYSSQGVGFALINSNDPTAYQKEAKAALAKQLADSGIAAPYLIDAGSALAQAFGAERSPQLFVFDGSGKLVYTGAIDDSPAASGEVGTAYLTNALDAMISGGSVADPSTKTIGCKLKPYS